MTGILEIKGRVPVKTDRGMAMYDWVVFEGEVWILGLGMISPDGRFAQPIRLVSLRAAEGYSIDRSDPALLDSFRGIRLPTTLLEQGVIPPELSKLVEVREFHWDTSPGRPVSH